MSSTQVTPSSTQTIVDIKTAWLSKINWTQAIGIGASVLVVVSGGKYNIPADQQVELVAGIQAITGFITWILRTWFNGTVSPGSLPSK